MYWNIPEEFTITNIGLRLPTFYIKIIKKYLIAGLYKIFYTKSIHVSHFWLRLLWVLFVFQYDLGLKEWNEIIICSTDTCAELTLRFVASRRR
jgi:hypothetical protein